MNRLLPTAIAAAGAITLAGCNLLNAPSDTILKQCLAIGEQAPLDIPLSAYVDWADAHGQELRWEHLDGGHFIVRFRPSDAPAEADSEIGLELRNSNLPSKQSNCGPGRVSIVGASVNGEMLNLRGMQPLVDRLVEKLREHMANPGASAVSRPVDASPPQQPIDNQMGVNQEAEAEGRYYAEQADRALESPIQITSDMTTYYCCMTLQTIVDDFRRTGATPQVSTADSGAVWLKVKDSRGSWRGWTDLEFEFVPPYPGNNILVLSSIKNGGREVANINEGGVKSTNNLLRERFRLKATQEPTS